MASNKTDIDNNNEDGNGDEDDDDAIKQRLNMLIKNAPAQVRGRKPTSDEIDEMRKFKATVKELISSQPPPNDEEEGDRDGLSYAAIKTQIQGVEGKETKQSKQQPKPKKVRNKRGVKPRRPVPSIKNKQQHEQDDNKIKYVNPDHNQTDDLLRGMATALSIDVWEPTKSSKCEYEDDPSLAVNFVCMHPRDDDGDDNVPKTATSPKDTASSSSSSSSSHTSTTTPSPQPPNRAEAARYQEIFIDLVGMGCALNDTASRHVLDDRFDSFLAPGERAFKDSLIEFLQQQTNESKSTHAYTYLETILQEKMGFKNTYRWADRKDIYNRLPSSSDTSLNSSNDDNGNENHDSDDCVSLDETSVPRPRLSKSPGHVFVCNGSVCDIQCDAFLCPGALSSKKGSIWGSIVKQWKDRIGRNHPSLKGIIENPRPLIFHSDYDRVATWKDWPIEERNLPLFIAGEVSIEKSRAFANMQTNSSNRNLPSEQQHIAALLETLRQFLDMASTLVRSHSPHTFRERYLLAVPVLGTGGGFAGDLTGQIIKKLLVNLNQFTATQSEFDVVLACADEATYAHAQVIRRELLGPLFISNSKAEKNNPQPRNNQFPCFYLLSGKQRHAARQLANFASNSHLSLFIGAGVSIGSGLPSWFGLLLAIEDYFTPTGDPSERRIGDDCNWNPLEMAQRLSIMGEDRDDKNGTRMSLKRRVCRYLQKNGSHPGLLLCLLISLPCHSIVTQNYDQLIEKACDCWNVSRRYGIIKMETKSDLSVIPYMPRKNARYWLLKMHGCVTAPEEIILTQSDYDTYDTSPRSKALAGLVQASLLTKHLLFVGFSLTDPNYLRIVDQVREALRPYSGDS